MSRYFAYGSNMFTAQMSERCPGAANPVPAVLADHAWLCNERGVATISPVVGREVHGVVWDVTDEHLDSLDQYEGVAAGRYRRATTTVTTAAGERITAVVYIDNRVEPGPPRPGYLERVLAGASEHQLPTKWLTYLRRWANVPASPARTLTNPSGPQRLSQLLALPDIDEVVELSSTFGFMAIHGGGLESTTDVIAARAAASAGASYYGVLHPADVDHHLPSTAYQAHDSRGLARFLDHVDTVVSIHGYGRRNRWTQVLVGGSNRRLAEHVAAHLGPRLDGYEIVTDIDEIPPGLRGQHPDNPVNQTSGGGVQLELPPRIRGLSPLSPPPDEDGLSPPTRSLIDGLASAARTWDAAQSDRQPDAR